MVETGKDPGFSPQTRPESNCGGTCTKTRESIFNWYYLCSFKIERHSAVDADGPTGDSWLPRQTSNPPRRLPASPAAGLWLHALNKLPPSSSSACSRALQLLEYQHRG
eukprot:GHVU01102749.1.p3 GENE.GHVU01102749.1~~GHVU01102749.1.p3  ORF type:complete len:108 (+),score=2.81 GHVU01102749.1:230-553(+)